MPHEEKVLRRALLTAVCSSECKGLVVYKNICNDLTYLDTIPLMFRLLSGVTDL